MKKITIILCIFAAVSSYVYPAAAAPAEQANRIQNEIHEAAEAGRQEAREFIRRLKIMSTLEVERYAAQLDREYVKKKDRLQEGSTKRHAEVAAALPKKQRRHSV